ncbi:MAG: gliding motility-associated C-terminal domain-containing protein [Bacteroidales bacterium]
MLISLQIDSAGIKMNKFKTMHLLNSHIIKIHLLVIAGCFMASQAYTQLDIPDAPVFKSASVVPGSDPAEVNLTWLPSDSLDVDSYIIYKVNTGITQAYDTVWGRLTTSYTDDVTMASDEPVTYRLAARDSLENLSKLTDPHSTMHVVPDYEICDLEIQLEWTDYIGWNNIDHYDVYRNTTGGSFDRIKTVNGNTSEYVDKTLQAFVNYCYYIEAVRSDGTAAKSNEVCVYTSSYVPPAWINADYASVEGDSIELRFTVDTSGEVNSYKILRATDSADVFTAIQTIENDNQSKIYYIDTDVEPSKNKYYYKLRSIDPCENVSKESNISSNLMVTVESDRMLDHHIAWDEYETYRGGVLEYKVYRHFGYDAPVSVASMDADVFTHSNNISDYVKKKHKLNKTVPHQYCYYVAAVEDSSENPLNIQGVSKSNEVCVSHRPLFFIPNTFYPNSYEEINRCFKPMVSFAREDGYKFVVYDRWGIEIFSTKEPYEAWDGSTENRKAPPGKYVYYVRFLDHEGKEFVRSGVFLLYNE